MARYARSIDAPAGELNTVAGAFAERMATLDSGVRAALGLIEVTRPTNAARARGSSWNSS